MVTDKKRKLELSLSDSPTQDGGNKKSKALESKIATHSAELMADLKALKSEIATHSAEFKANAAELKPMLKHYVRERGLTLVREFIGFVSQIHGIEMQQKFDEEGYQIQKFTKLIATQDFRSDCPLLLNGENDPKKKSTSDILTISSNVCDTRNKLMHFTELEDCVYKIEKFKKKFSNLLVKCTYEVQFCVFNIQAMASIL